MSKRALEQWREDKSACISTMKVSLSTNVLRLCHCRVAITAVKSEFFVGHSYIMTLYIVYLRGTVFPEPVV